MVDMNVYISKKGKDTRARWKPFRKSHAMGLQISKEAFKIYQQENFDSPEEYLRQIMINTVALFQLAQEEGMTRDMYDNDFLEEFKLVGTSGKRELKQFSEKMRKHKEEVKKNLTFK